MLKYKAVIFDLDDTLYPEIEYVKSGFKISAGFISSVIDHDSSEIYDKLLNTFEDNRSCVYDRLLMSYGFDNQKLVEKCVDSYRNHFPKIELNSENEELLKWLKNISIKIGIITDGRPEGQRMKIQALGLEKYCDKIIITDELGGLEYRKPCEISYKKILSDLNVFSKEAIFVGDNPSKDFITANKLGMTTVMLVNINPTYKQIGYPQEYCANYSVKTLEEIKNILEDGAL